MASPLPTDYQFEDPCRGGRVLRSNFKTAQSTTSLYVENSDSDTSNGSPSSSVSYAESKTSQFLSRKPRTLTDVRKTKILKFIKMHVSESKMFGEIGTNKWSTELIKFLKEPRNRMLLPSDVTNWIEKDADFFTEAYERERENQTRRRNSIHGSLQNSIPSPVTSGSTAPLSLSNRSEAVRSNSSVDMQVSTDCFTPMDDQNGSATPICDEDKADKRELETHTWRSNSIHGTLQAPATSSSTIPLNLSCRYVAVRASSPLDMQVSIDCFTPMEIHTGSASPRCDEDKADKREPETHTWRSNSIRGTLQDSFPSPATSSSTVPLNLSSRSEDVRANSPVDIKVFANFDNDPMENRAGSTTPRCEVAIKPPMEDNSPATPGSQMCPVTEIKSNLSNAVDDGMFQATPENLQFMADVFGKLLEMADFHSTR